jgi:AraC-like DNA-binding protein
MPNHPEIIADHPDFWKFDELFSGLEIRCDLAVRVQLHQPVGVIFPNTPGTIRFEYVESGRVFVSLLGGEMHILEPGDLMIVSSELPLMACTSPDAERMSLDEFMARVDMPCKSGLNILYGHGENRCSLLSGRSRIIDGRTHPIWRGLPPLLILRPEDDRQAQARQEILRQAENEARHPQPGSRGILDRLLEVALVRGIRTYLSQNGLLATAVRDPEVFRVMSLVHEDAAHPWTLASMSSAVGLSRSSFAERFTRATGTSPAEYVTTWRMHRAAKLMRERGATIAGVAMSVGYASEAAFARTFRRVVGVSPGRFARTPVGGV